MRIGVLALQGDFIEHISTLKKLGVKAIPVHKPDELKDLDGLIFPGGESTTITNLMYSSSLFKPLKELAQAGLPIMGTCAGTVLMAKKVSGFNMALLALILSPVKTEVIKAIADAGDRMPRKATYFYPKLPSGLVFNRLI